MRDAAMMLEPFHGSGKAPENVDIGGFGGQRGGQRGVGSFAIQSRAANAGAGEEMREGFHACCSP